MTIRPAEPHRIRLLSYAIASADMYYAEMEQLDVFLNCDEQGSFYIGGKMTDGESSTTDFLRYFWNTLYIVVHGLLWKRRFMICRTLDNVLADRSQNSLKTMSCYPNLTIRLKYIFETVDAYPSVLRFQRRIHTANCRSDAQRNPNCH